MGSCTDLRGMIPGAFTSATARALAVDRVAKAVHHAAQQRLADGNVHDRARALDGVAFLDVAVVAEDHDTHVVGLKVQHHAPDTAGKLDHLAGLHLVEAVNAGDAVTDRQHLADLGHLGILTEILDLILEDGRNLGSLDSHYPTSFIAFWREASFERTDESTICEPSLTIMPPMRLSSTRVFSFTVLPDFSASVSRSRFC